MNDRLEVAIGLGEIKPGYLYRCSDNDQTDLHAREVVEIMRLLELHTILFRTVAIKQGGHDTLLFQMHAAFMTIVTDSHLVLRAFFPRPSRVRPRF